MAPELRLKEEGNDFFRVKKFTEAIMKYSQAIVSDFVFRENSNSPSLVSESKWDKPNLLPESSQVLQGA